MSTITGTIKRVNPAETRGEYTNQSIVVTIEPGQYQQDVQFELAKKIQPIADSLREGEEVEVSYNLRGRDYADRDGVQRNYTSLSAWRIDRKKNQQPAAQEQQGPVSNGWSPGQSDDLPF